MGRQSSKWLLFKIDYDEIDDENLMNVYNFFNFIKIDVETSLEDKKKYSEILTPQWLAKEMIEKLNFNNCVNFFIYH